MVSNIKNLLVHGRSLALLICLSVCLGNSLNAQSITGLAAQYCETDGDVTLTGSPSGGVFSGPGVSGSTFSPSTAGPGSHTVNYDPLTYSHSTVSFQSITGGGTTISLADDANSNALPIGFTFNFYGNSYTQVYASSNGFLSFDAGASTSNTNSCLGDVASPNNAVFFYYTDLDPGNGLQGNGENRIWYTTVGTAPNREFRITFWNVDQFADGNNVFIRCRLFETSGNIRVDIQNAPSDGGNVTIGLEGAGGANSNGPVSCTNPGAISSRSYLFTKSSAATASTTVFATPSAANAGTDQTVAVSNTTMAATAPTTGT